MTIRLYQKSTSEAFHLTNMSLQRLGFTIYFADVMHGIVRTQKKLNSTGQIIFFDVQVSAKNYGVGLSLISNRFSESTCTFIADDLSEDLFLEALHDLLRIQPPDNPMKLNENDYAMAVAF
jgi:hypothetical protein